jgi:hypothetical protein
MHVLIHLLPLIGVEGICSLVQLVLLHGRQKLVQIIHAHAACQDLADAGNKAIDTFS